MSPELVGTLGFVAITVLILCGVPIAVSLGLVGVAGLLFIQPWSTVSYMVGMVPFETLYPYSMSVVPLFIAMGVFASHAGLSRDLYQTVTSFFGHRRGGLAKATVIACSIFSAICGSSIATAATMCRVALPEMRKAGYDDRLATAVIAAGGTLGVMIPPSIMMVVYGLLTETSIGKLFIAGILPGILGTFLYMLAVDMWCRMQPGIAPKAPRQRAKERLQSIGQVWTVMLLFVAVIGGIYAGLFSTTEGAAVGAGGAALITLLRGKLDRVFLRNSVNETVGVVGMIFLIMIGGALFAVFIEASRLPLLLGSFVKDVGVSPLTLIIVLMGIYIVLGCLLDSFSMILLTVPFVFPIIKELGIDPVWFGVLLVTVVEIGLITPPVGINLFVIQDAAKVPSIIPIRGILPFVVADVVRLALLIAFPVISLYLPGQMK